MRFFKASSLFAGIVAVGLVGCDVDVKDTGKLPDVDIDAEPGEMPEVDVRGPDVEVGTEEKQVTVPDVDINTEETTIEVPTIDVDVPEENETEVEAGEPELEETEEVQE